MTVEEAIRHARVRAREMKIDPALTIAEVYEGEFLRQLQQVKRGMYHPPPLRGRAVLVGKKVLLIDRNQPTCDVRARVLQSHGVEVHTAEDLSGARQLESYF